MTGPDPGRCDLCVRELAIGETLYTYFTPCTATLEEAEAHRGDPRFFWAEDPEWSLCISCHQYLVMLDAGQDRDLWIKRMVKRSLRNQLVPPSELARAFQVEYAVSTLKGFLEHRSPEFTVEVNEGVGR